MIDALIPLTIFDASAFFGWFVENANYWFVFIFMIIESSFIPFPSELVVPPAAYLAATKGDMNVTAVILIATAGALVGALVNYFLSLWIGRPLVYRFADSRFGHACLIDRAKVENAEKYFDQHGAASTFFGRLIPAVRQLISIPAGLARMNIGMFALFTSLGALLWNSVLAGLGYWLGQTVPLQLLYEKIEEYNKYLNYIGIAILVVCVIYILYHAFLKKQK
jgi:membrane protein DedA with SNARE-associated domain